MKTLDNNFLENLYITSFSLFFIFNFLDRHLANIFLLITLFLCLINYKKIYKSIIDNKELIFCILLFSSYISFVGYYHSSPMSELDNYYRFLLLLPILAIPFDENRMINILSLCALAAFVNFIYIYKLTELSIDRFSGPASVAITYANMCSTLFVICIYYLFYKNHKSKRLVLSAIIFLALLILTGTRGPVIGILISLLYLSYELFKASEDKIKSTKPLIILLILVISITSIPNPLGDRLKEISKINLSEPMNIENKSLRERIYYLNYGIDRLGDNYLIGIGPENLVSDMKESLDGKARGKYHIFPKDHLHNEFLDISVKFGLLSLVLLLLIYYLMFKSKDTEHKVLFNIVMLMLICSQLTQSQLSHHQAITFFIVLIYILLRKSMRYSP